MSEYFMPSRKRDRRFELRLSELEQIEWSEAARAAGRSVGSWLRTLATQVVRRRNQKMARAVGGPT